MSSGPGGPAGEVGRESNAIAGELSVEEALARMNDDLEAAMSEAQ